MEDMEDSEVSEGPDLSVVSVEDLKLRHGKRQLDYQGPTEECGSADSKKIRSEDTNPVDQDEMFKNSFSLGDSVYGTAGKQKGKIGKIVKIQMNWAMVSVDEGEAPVRMYYRHMKHENKDNVNLESSVIAPGDLVQVQKRTIAVVTRVDGMLYQVLLKTGQFMKSASVEKHDVRTNASYKDSKGKIIRSGDNVTVRNDNGRAAQVGVVKYLLGNHAFVYSRSTTEQDGWIIANMDNVDLFSGTVEEVVPAPEGSNAVEEIPIIESFQCKWCDASFDSERDLKKHKCYDINDYLIEQNGEKKFGCSGNGQPCAVKGYPNKDSLRRHIRTQHLKPKKKEMFKCPHCKTEYFSKVCLENHDCPLKNNPNDPNVVFTEDDCIKFLERTPDNRFACSVCPDLSFRFKTDFMNHVLRDHLKSPHRCLYCKKRFLESKIRLQRHMDTCSRNPDRKKVHFCTSCPDLTFQTANGLLLHRLSKHSDLRIKCDNCEEDFETFAEKQYHRRSVHGQKPYICPICEKAFANKSRLAQHMELHSETNQFVCNKCQKKFHESNTLYVHDKIKHQPQTRYECPWKECGLWFNYKTQWRLHQITEHMEIRYFQCPDCFRKFKTQDCLNRHFMRNCCTKCDYEFEDDDAKRNHFELQHGGLYGLAKASCEMRAILKKLPDMKTIEDMKTEFMKIYQLSKSIYPLQNVRRKLYCLLFVPKTVTDIHKYISNSANEWFLYIGKMSLGLSSMTHIPKHHLIIQRNGMTNTNRLCLSGFKMVHVFDQWMICDIETLDKMEALLILKLFLFCKKYDCNHFFQKMELLPIVNVRSEEIEDIVKDVNDCNGDFFQLNNCKKQFYYEYPEVICMNGDKLPVIENFKCPQCGIQDKLYTKPLLKRHLSKCGQKESSSSDSDSDIESDNTLDFYKLKELDSRQIFELLNNYKRKTQANFICYSVVGAEKVFALRETLVKFMEKRKSFEIYYGQSSFGRTSQYHFAEGISSTLKNIAFKQKQLYELNYWTCSDANIMYRLEVALQLRELFTGIIHFGCRTLSNRYLQLYDVSSKFTEEEWNTLWDYCSAVYAVELEPPIFLTAVREPKFANITTQILQNSRNAKEDKSILMFCDAAYEWDDGLYDDDYFEDDSDDEEEYVEELNE